MAGSRTSWSRTDCAVDAMSVERVPLWPSGAVPTPGAAHTHAQLVELMRDDPLYESHLRAWFESGVAGGWIDGAAETPDLELYPLPPRDPS